MSALNMQAAHAATAAFHILLSRSFPKFCMHSTLPTHTLLYGLVGMCVTKSPEEGEPGPCGQTGVSLWGREAHPRGAPAAQGWSVPPQAPPACRLLQVFLAACPRAWVIPGGGHGHGRAGVSYQAVCSLVAHLTSMGPSWLIRKMSSLNSDVPQTGVRSGIGSGRPQPPSHPIPGGGDAVSFCAVRPHKGLRQCTCFPVQSLAS